MNILYIGEYSSIVKKLFSNFKKYKLTIFETKNNIQIATNKFLQNNTNINNIYLINSLSDIFHNLFIKEKKEYDIIYIQSLKYVNDILLLLLFTFSKKSSVLMIKDYQKKKDVIHNLIKIIKKKYILSFKNNTLLLKTNLESSVHNFIPTIFIFHHKTNNQKLIFHLSQKKEKPVNCTNINFENIKLFNYKYLNKNNDNKFILHPFYLLQVNSYFAYLNNHIFQYIDRKNILFDKVAQLTPFFTIFDFFLKFKIIQKILENQKNSTITILHQNFIPFESCIIYNLLEIFNSIIPIKLKIIDLTTYKTNQNIFNTFEFNQANYMKIFFNHNILNDEILKISHKLPKVDYITLPRNFYNSTDVFCIKQFLLSIIFISKIQQKGGCFMLYIKNTFDKAMHDILMICDQMYEEVSLENTILYPYTTFLIAKKFNPNPLLIGKLEQMYYEIDEELYIHELLENKIETKYLHQINLYQENRYDFLKKYQNKIYKFIEKNQNNMNEIIFYQLSIFFSFLKKMFF